MPEVNSLAQLQACFTKQLTLKVSKSTGNQKPKTKLDSLTHLLIESHFTPEQLINIYRSNFIISLRELLENLFPITQALVGNEYFTQTSRQFINDCPLKEPHLNYYGSNFVYFLKGLKALEHMPFVAQMAQLEWHLDRISHIYHQPNFDFDGLTQISEDQYMNIHFKLAETCHLQASSINLIALHKDLSAGQDPSLQGDIKEPNYQQQSYILVLQNHHGESALMPINLQHWTWLNGLKNGLTLAQLCETLNTDIASLMAQITDWIALGCINGFSLIADTQP